MSVVEEAIFRANESGKINIIEEFTFESKQANFTQIPEKLHPQIKSVLSISYPNGLYSHQAKAIDLGIQSKNICVTTPTASGKTVIFTSIVLSKLLENSASVALILYPVKALIHDQTEKWSNMLKNTNIVSSVIHGSYCQMWCMDIIEFRRQFVVDG